MSPCGCADGSGLGPFERARRGASTRRAKVIFFTGVHNKYAELSQAENEQVELEDVNASHDYEALRARTNASDNRSCRRE